MTDHDYATTMSAVYYWGFSSGEYSNGGAADSLQEIIAQLPKDSARYVSQSFELSVRCKYEDGECFTIRSRWDRERGCYVLYGDNRGSYAQPCLIHSLREMIGKDYVKSDGK